MENGWNIRKDGASDMKQLTRIMTVRITMVDRLEEDDEVRSKEEHKKLMEDVLKDTLGLRDCVVTDVQDSIVDVKGE